MSVWARPPAAPYVLAYEVRTVVANRQDGHREINYIIDAVTGAILRKWSALRGDTATQGSGHSFFRGTVPLSTAQAADGTYGLYALDRGTRPQPVLAQIGSRRPASPPITASSTSPRGFPAWLPTPGTPATSGARATSSASPSARRASSSTTMPPGRPRGRRGALTPDGETTAVDAHYGLTTAWDFFHNVFQRNGFDGQGTSTCAIVHAITGATLDDASPITEAYWSPGLYGMVIGDGAFKIFPTGPRLSPSSTSSATRPPTPSRS